MRRVLFVVIVRKKNRRQIKKYLWPINKYVKLQSVLNIAALSTILDAVNVFL